MSDMQFETDNANEFGRPAEAGGLDLTGKLITWGLVSTRKEAEYVMIALAVVIAIIAFFVYRSSSY